MSWIHIEDMVDAIIHIIENQALQGPINMTSEQTVTNKQFSSSLANTLNRPCLFSTPGLLLKLMFGEMADLLLYGQNVQPEKLKMSNFKFKYKNLDNALKNLLND
jgi:NAD dependent epimerase/dehydratase family enzyme